MKVMKLSLNKDEFQAKDLWLKRNQKLSLSIHRVLLRVNLLIADRPPKIRRRNMLVSEVAQIDLMVA